MNKLRQLKSGMLVRHKTKGYIGVFDDVTHMQHLFENPSDTFGCRVRVGYNKIEIASRENIEILHDIRLKDRHKANRTPFGFEQKGNKMAKNRYYLRVTRCWRCKKHLDNTANSECVKCRWILCQCGACGCG